MTWERIRQSQMLTGAIAGVRSQRSGAILNAEWCNGQKSRDRYAVDFKRLYEFQIEHNKRSLKRKYTDYKYPLRDL